MNDVRNKYIIILLFFIPACLFAQKIETGSCTTKDGGSYQGQMFRGKPNGRGKTVYKKGNVYEGEYMKGLRQGEVPILSLMERNISVSGSRTNSTDKVFIILPMATAMTAYGIRIISRGKEQCIITMVTST